MKPKLFFRYRLWWTTASIGTPEYHAFIRWLRAIRANGH
jgi:hypothetical protein